MKKSEIRDDIEDAISLLETITHRLEDDPDPKRDSLDAEVLALLHEIMDTHPLEWELADKIKTLIKVRC